MGDLCFGTQVGEFGAKQHGFFYTCCIDLAETSEKQ